MWHETFSSYLPNCCNLILPLLSQSNETKHRIGAFCKRQFSKSIMDDTLTILEKVVYSRIEYCDRKKTKSVYRRYHGKWFRFSSKIIMFVCCELVNSSLSINVCTVHIILYSGEKIEKKLKPIFLEEHVFTGRNTWALKLTSFALSSVDVNNLNFSLILSCPNPIIMLNYIG